MWLHVDAQGVVTQDVRQVWLSLLGQAEGRQGRVVHDSDIDMTTPNAEGMTITEASTRLGRSPRTLHRWIDEGKVKAWKVQRDGHEVWLVDIAGVHDGDHATTTADIHDVNAEILDLREEVAWLRDQLRVKDGQIADLNARLHEANALVMAGQKQLSEPGKRPWWAFWRR